MDNVNTQIGQNFARESASTLTDKSFNANNTVGFASGASAFTKSESPVVLQQVRNLDKAASQLAEKPIVDEQKALKDTGSRADTVSSENGADLSESLDAVNAFLQSKGTDIAFSIDDATEKAVVTVKDAASGDVIRQIPSEEVLNFAERMNDLQSDIGSQIGVLINRQA